MTDVRTEAPPAAVDLGHPVSSFVAVMVALAALLTGLDWSGAIQPNVRVKSQMATTAVDDRELQAVLLQNEGVFPVEVERIEWGNPRWTDVGVAVMEPGARGTRADVAAGETADPFRLESRDERWVVVTGRQPCGFGPSNLVVHLRSQAGVHSTMRLPVVWSDSVVDVPTCPP
jgi:hypothetical protein